LTYLLVISQRIYILGFVVFFIHQIYVQFSKNNLLAYYPQLLRQLQILFIHVREVPFIS